MDNILHTVVVISLLCIVYQDIQYRAVYWFLFPIIIIGSGILHYTHTMDFYFYTSTLLNSILVLSILTILFLYNRIIVKKSFFKEVFGLGDVLFFVALAVAFPTITFIIIFCFALFFSMLVWLIFRKKAKHNTVPLAGYMALFLTGVYTMSWLTKTGNLYMI
ncbi:hypothetical protein [Aquimarina brevivitae]|uniref:Type IV leader peptidase family protein n=1 Tax=Aquimarina brevivitae TaxID=323412 RepID=A0A4Q7P0Z2_9FLAO|nr:hypothetical protein [Aquimarina brevivitae]RZS92312.1 hypothetical protein EV197_2950 [Aquimarina brevivitae]